MINFSCTNCGKHFQVGDELAGRMGKCKSCGHHISIPSANPVSRPNTGPQAMLPHGPSAPLHNATTTPDDGEYTLQPQNPYSASQPAYVPPNPYQPYPPQAPAPYPTQYVPNGPTGGYSHGTPGYGQPNYQQPNPNAGYPAYNLPNPQAYGYAPQPTVAVTRSPVRLRRLQADLQQMQQAFSASPLMRVQSVLGNPPEKYVIEYRVRGLVRGPQGTPIYRDQHFVEIQLTSEYPRQSPKCRMLTPIFHPNIEPATICVGDHWTAGERLVDLVVRIAEMIAYQAYNIKSPLDGEAAMWADHNRQHFPVDRRDMQPAERT